MSSKEKKQAREVQRRLGVPYTMALRLVRQAHAEGSLDVVARAIELSAEAVG